MRGHSEKNKIYGKLLKVNVGIRRKWEKSKSKSFF